MKKTSKYLIYAIIFVVLAGILFFYSFANTAKDVTTQEFFDNAGVIIVEDNVEFTPDGEQYKLENGVKSVKIGKIFSTNSLCACADTIFEPAV